ncbi:hypothetical protein [Sphingobium yanoikuyae]|uniref:hypothetical protein n=1 Tax=Sphingobium yanoikuyae TaxID=13690 RepID=UPI0028AA9ED5|nr:hypothetical protein [Sphingobium yanoikuyae]
MSDQKRRPYSLQDFVYAEAEAILRSKEELFEEFDGVTDWVNLTPAQDGAIRELKRRRLIPPERPPLADGHVDDSGSDGLQDEDCYD